MIETIIVEHSNMKANRKKYKNDWVSSVGLSLQGIDTAKLRKVCKKSERFHAIRFDINNTIKYWFEKRFLSEMIEAAKARRYQL